MEKFGIDISIGIIGSAIAEIFGGWNSAMTTLMIFMLIDYATGLTVASLFNNSPKSKYGGIESNACWKGLARKFATLLLVIISVRLDLLLETNYIHTCVIIAFITNELISITENVGLMGLPLPKVITNVIEVLKGKEDEF